MARRYYSSTAVATTLVGAVNSSVTTIQLVGVSGLPGSYPFTLILDADAATEEVVDVTGALGGNQFTVSRGADGTTGQGHSAGAVVRHGFSKRDLDEPNEHINATTNVHGLASGVAVVGTTTVQTLTNKTLTAPTISSPALSGTTTGTPTIAGATLTGATLVSPALSGTTTGTPTIAGATLTGATLTAPTISSPALSGTTTGTPTIAGATLTGATLTTPTVTSFVNATHSHETATGGGTVALAALTGLAGVILPFGGAAAPTGFLLCDGTAVSRATYATLFAITGVTYGVGNGSTTFNLPSLSGRAPVGRDAAQAEFDTLGETGGAKTHTLISGEMPSHTHVQDAHAHGPSGGTSFWVGSGAADNIASGSATNRTTSGTTANATATNQNTGGGGAHNNLQPYIVLNYIIKT